MRTRKLRDSMCFLCPNDGDEEETLKYEYYFWADKCYKVHGDLNPLVIQGWEPFMMAAIGEYLVVTLRRPAATAKLEVKIT